MLEIALTEGIIIALIGLVGIITPIILNKKMSSIEKRQEKTERWSEETHHQVHNNGGASLKDGVDQLKGLVTEVIHNQELQSKDIQYVHDGMVRNAENIEHLRDHQTELDLRLDRERRDREAADEKTIQYGRRKDD